MSLRPGEPAGRWVLRALPVYAVAAVVTTWPLALHPTSLLGSTAGAGDAYLNLWALGWGLGTLLSDPLALITGSVFDANIFYPAAATLAYSDHLLLQSVVLAPLYAITGDVVLCYNALLLMSLIASALAMHAFVRQVVGPTAGAYIAGLAWGFGSYPFSHLTHVQLQSLYFLPLAFLFLHRLMAGARRRDAVLLGVIAGLQAISSVYYAVIGGIALVLGAVVLAACSTPRPRLRIVSQLALAAVIAGVMVLPIGVVYWRVQQSEGFGRNLYQAGQGAAYVDSYLQVPVGNLLYGRTGLLRQTDPTPAGGPPHSGPEREAFPGFVLIALAMIGFWRGWRSDARPLVTTMALLGLLGFVLSLGPDGVRPVYAAAHRFIFGFQAIRAPGRFALLVAFSLATLGALGWRELFSGAHRLVRRPAVALPALVCALAVAEWLHVPIMLVDAPPPRTEVGDWLRRAPGAGPVAFLPLDLDVEGTVVMVQSLEHRRPLLNGYSGQRPSFYPALADALNAFPADEALLALLESGVQYVVTGTPVARSDGSAPSPLVLKAELASGAIYELQWTPEAEERVRRVTSVTPPPVGRLPFSIGEVARYVVRWDGIGMGLVAGDVTVTVEPPGYRLVATAFTASWVSRFINATERFATTTDAGLLPSLHEREQHEGSRDVSRVFIFDRAAGVVRIGGSVDAARAPDAVSLPLAASARDAIAALFYVRTLPLETNDQYLVPVNEGGRNLIIDVRVAGRETVTVNGESVAAVRLEPQIRQRVARRQLPTAHIWLSADDRRVPLAVDLLAGFGRVRIELSSYQPGS